MYSFRALLLLLLLASVAQAAEILVPNKADLWKWDAPAKQRDAVTWVDSHRGWRFDATKGHGTVYSPWPIGNEPFKVSWDARLESGNAQSWRLNGGYLAITSALPEEMTDDDLALAISFNREGLSMRAQRNGLFAPRRVDHPTKKTITAYSRLNDENLAARDVLNKGGAGGAMYSILWPTRSVKDLDLHLTIERDDKDNIRFTAERYMPDGSRLPWHERSFQLPKTHTSAALQYLVISTTLNTNEYGHAAKEWTEPTQKDDPVRGVFCNIQARPLAGEPTPVVEGITAAGPFGAGVSATIRGKGFAPGARVMLGDAEPIAATDVKDDSLTVRLPALEEGKTHQLRVINPAGAFGPLAGGVPFGRTLLRVEPYEASPKGGDEVDVVGGGFTAKTVVRFNDKPAEVIKLHDSTRLTVRVPAGAVGAARVEASDGEAAFSGSPRFGFSPHPYLAFDEKKLATLRKRFNDPQFAHYRAAIMENVDKAMNQELPLSKIAAGGAGQGYADTALSTVNGLSWGYLFTGDRKYFDKLMLVVEELSRTPNTLDFHVLVIQAMANAYDTLFTELSPREKVVFQRYLDFTFDDFRDRVRAKLWFLTNLSNTNPVSNGGGTVAGLSIYHSRPKEVEEIAKQAVQNMQSFANGCLTADGASVEGAMYWNFGLTHYLEVSHALKNTLGHDYGMSEHPNVNNAMNFAQAMLGGDGTMMVFNNSQPFLVGAGIFAHFDAKQDSDLARWLADEVVRKQAIGKESRLGVREAFVWRTDKPAPKDFPGVPVVAVLDKVQWGSLRSDGAYHPRLQIGMKGRAGRVTHHTQPDLGSIVAYARGESFLIDPGYYRGDKEFHSLPLLDGRCGNRLGEAFIRNHGHAGDLRWAELDVTPAYNQPDKGDEKIQTEAKAKRVNRVIVLAGDQAVILDDIVPIDGALGIVTAQYQAGWKTEVAEDGKSSLILGKKATMRLQTFGTDLKLKTEGPLPFKGKGFNSWIYARLAEAGNVEWHKLSGDYKANPAEPLVTVLSTAEKASPPPIARVTRGADRIEVTTEVAGPVVFERKEGVWTFVKPAELK